MNRPRPLIRLGQAELMALYPRVCNDFELLVAFVHELQFRSAMSKPFKADALDQLLTLQAQTHSLADKVKTLSPAKARLPSPLTPDFDFPTTDILQTRKKLMNSRFVGRPWHDVGLLSVSGYTVGSKEGKSTKERRSILNWIFLKDELQDIDDPAYAAEWGKPKSSIRLKKLAHSLAAFARNAQRSPNDMHIAIQEWTEDLDYLYQTFYLRWHEFPWPKVEI